jgi:hypothetical protein
MARKLFPAACSTRIGAARGRDRIIPAPSREPSRQNLAGVVLYHPANEEDEMTKTIMVLLPIVAMVFFLSACPVEPPVGTMENPLVLDTYSGSNVRYSATIGEEELYVKVINIPYFNNAHTVTLTGLTGDVDLFTYSDAFVTEEDSSESAGIAAEDATGTTTATGELYILIDGSVSTGTKWFTLDAGT